MPTSLKCTQYDVSVPVRHRECTLAGCDCPCHTDPLLVDTGAGVPAHYVALEVNIHGLNNERMPQQVADLVRQALFDIFTPLLDSDIEVEIIESA
jgi:hypothetical protein